MLGYNIDEAKQFPPLVDSAFQLCAQRAALCRASALAGVVVVIVYISVFYISYIQMRSILISDPIKPYKRLSSNQDNPPKESSQKGDFSVLKDCRGRICNEDSCFGVHIYLGFTVPRKDGYHGGMWADQ